MTGNDFVYLIHKSIFTKGLCAAQDLLSGLEDKLHAASKVLFHSLQCLGSSQQHRCMSIVSAGMHFTRMRRGIGQTGFFLNGKRIKVSADGDSLIADPFVQGGDNAGSPQFPGVWNTDGIQLSADYRNGFGQIKADFGNLM